MTTTTHDFVAQTFTNDGRALGPVTRSRLKRSAWIYAAVCGLGLLPTLLGLSPGLRAAGLGLWFPGAGFLASAGWSLLLLPLTLALFALAVFAWFGAGMVIAPAIVWLGAALFAGALGADGTWSGAGALVPALTVAGGWLLHRRGERERAAGRAKRAVRAKFLPAETAAVAARVKSAPAPSRELSSEDLAWLRYLLDRGLQPVGQLAGFDKIDQFQTSALRYQINHLGYALSEFQTHYAPSFQGYLAQAQRNLIEQYLERPIWSYWIYETAWGHLNFTDFDPAGRDNIMLTGWFGIQVSLYTSATGDRRYAEPGSLPFALNERKTYAHDVHTLARSVAQNLEASAFCLYPCEPNWVYPICNHYGMTSLVLHDRLFGTSYSADHMDRWLESLDQEFTDESGSVIGLRSSLTGLKFPFPAGDGAFAVFMNAWNPERAQRLWAAARHDLAQALVDDGRGGKRLALPGRGFDFGNYKRGWGHVFGSTLASAREFGDEEIAAACQRSLELHCAPRTDRGVSHYDGASNLANLCAITGRLRRTGDFRTAVLDGPPAATATGPVITDAPYPDVLVARATTDGEKLDVVLYPGEKPGVYSITVERLKPNREYQVREYAKQRFTADAQGKATLEIPIAGRTPFEIVPVA
jgi:hypothetical protein